jgi:hypothetical protein
MEAFQTIVLLGWTVVFLPITAVLGFKTFRKYPMLLLLLMLSVVLTMFGCRYFLLAIAIGMSGHGTNSDLVAAAVSWYIPAILIVSYVVYRYRLLTSR